VPPTIADIYATLESPPNPRQRNAIELLDGPLRIIAGPGSGKTHVLVVRTLNLICCREIPPSRIVVVTFTERAARELQDRIRLYANHLGEIPRQLAELNVGTIHWFCGVVLRRHHPTLRRYEPLDALGQKLFIYRRLNEICEDLRPGGRYLGRWRSKSSAVYELAGWLNKVTEETITADQLRATGDPFLQMLATAYERYRTALTETGYLDFSAILRELYDLLSNDRAALQRAQAEYSHFMIDEYQDTNYVQEDVLLRLAAPAYNIAVVGDDDQSLYRFRGATVRNILEFEDRLRALGQQSRTVPLEVNYRSHPLVIQTYRDFMGDCDWVSEGVQFRATHDVLPDPGKQFGNYPATVGLRGTPVELADLVQLLIQRHAVRDANQIALLFYSVASDGRDVINALRQRGIECYAPRAGRFLDHEEVRHAVAVLWTLAGFSEEDPERPAGGPVSDTCDWASGCAAHLRRHAQATGLSAWLAAKRREIDALQRGQDMGASLLDLLYQALRYEPLRSVLADPIAATNLGYLTSLLRVFQQQFGFNVIHGGNRQYLPWALWTSFFYFLHSTGVDDVEKEESAPLGMVQVMTIHQAKGLEFPVVVVGSLDRTARSAKEIDRVLGPLYPRGAFEPTQRVTEFDWRRLFYVGFSRAQHLLIAYADGASHRFFQPLLRRVPDARTVDWDAVTHLMTREDVAPQKEKQVLSLTGHINVYRRCTRQYEFFNEDGFAPSFAAQVFFGTVVHQTIEDIHRHVLDARPEPLEEGLIEQYFQRNSELLRRRGIHPLAPTQREEAKAHVLRYFTSNRERLQHVIDTEVEVMLEQDKYVLDGRVDLIRSDDGALEMVDFKAQRRADQGEEFDAYRDQLALYWHLLEERYGRRPDRAILYFTGEDDVNRARVLVDLAQSDIRDVVRRFDATAQQILARQFRLIHYPPRDTCRACDFKHYCRRAEADGEE
jgi:DNA helicase-2/ATP-dependent DNA helicase PcrA